MLKALIFDLGNVIVPFDFKIGYARLEGLCGYAAHEIPARLRSTGLVRRFEAGEIEPEPFFEQIRCALDLRMEYPQFCDLWSSIFLKTPLIPGEFLAQLRRRCRLLLLSNTNAIHFAMVRSSYPELQHFDDHVLSYQVGVLKPDQRIYRKAIARAGCEPGECFFTDDLLENVEGARQAGMDAVQFISFEQLQEELRRRNL